MRNLELMGQLDDAWLTFDHAAEIARRTREFSEKSVRERGLQADA